jgi:hypothetical protein
MDLDALETSFDLVAPRGDELMEIFYANLFAAAPAVRPLSPARLLRVEHHAAEAACQGGCVRRAGRPGSRT